MLRSEQGFCLNSFPPYFSKLPNLPTAQLSSHNPAIVRLLPGQAVTYVSSTLGDADLSMSDQDLPFESVLAE